MKKVMGIVFIILTMLTLTSCKGVEKSLFDQLYDDNFETAVEISNKRYRAGYEEDFQKFKSYTYQEYEDLDVKWLVEDPNETLKYYGFENIIISSFSYHNEGCQPEIIECLSEQDAKKISEELSYGMYLYYYREKIVYNSALFSLIFMEGLDNLYFNRTFIYSTDQKILLGGTVQPAIYEFKLPETLESVGEYGLSFTKNIKKIICNEGLKRICFAGMITMKDLEEVELNEGLTTLGPLCFNYCFNLKKINIPSTLKKIYYYSFYNCDSLEYIVIPKTVEYIANGAFNKTNVYCEAESKPASWDDEFICEDAKVYWAGEWEYNSEGIPTPIK